MTPEIFEVSGVHNPENPDIAILTKEKRENF
jgi:hypothetical protein